MIRSWLLDLLCKALNEDPGLEKIRGVAQDSGEGRWTVQAAIDHAVPMPVISAALFARFSSRQDDSPAMKVVAALRNQFGGHAVTASGTDPGKAIQHPAPADRAPGPPQSAGRAPLTTPVRRLVRAHHLAPAMPRPTVAGDAGGAQVAVHGGNPSVAANGYSGLEWPVRASNLGVCT